MANGKAKPLRELLDWVYCISKSRDAWFSHSLHGAEYRSEPLFEGPEGKWAHLAPTIIFESEATLTDFLNDTRPGLRFHQAYVRIMRSGDCLPRVLTVAEAVGQIRSINHGYSFKAEAHEDGFKGILDSQVIRPRTGELLPPMMSSLQRTGWCFNDAFEASPERIFEIWCAINEIARDFSISTASPTKEGQAMTVRFQLPQQDIKRRPISESRYGHFVCQYEGETVVLQGEQVDYSGARILRVSNETYAKAWLMGDRADGVFYPANPVHVLKDCCDSARTRMSRVPESVHRTIPLDLLAAG